MEYGLKRWVVNGWLGFYLLAALVVARPVLAATEQPITLEQAIALALQHNPQLKAEQARLGISRAEILTAQARLNPVLVSDNGFAERTYRVGIQQTIELGGKRRRRIDLAKAQAAVTETDFLARRLALRLEVRRAYTQLYNLQQRQSATQDILAMAQRLLDITQQRERAGDVARLDVLQAEIIMVNARNDLMVITAQVTEARNRLNALLNQPLETAMLLTLPTDDMQQALQQLLTGPEPVTAGSLLPGTLPGKLIDIALNRRTEWQRNQQSLTVTTQQLAVAKAARIPNMTVAAGYDRVTGPGGQQGAFAIGALEIPLLNRQQGPIAEAQARQAQLLAEQAALRNQATLEITNALNNWQASRGRVERYETELLPKAVTIVGKARRSFEEGKSAILIPISAQQAFNNTRLGYLQALLEHQQAIGELERVLAL